jgi:hypothetical protein
LLPLAVICRTLASLGSYSWWTPCFFWLQATPVQSTAEGNRQKFNCKSNAKVVFILSFVFRTFASPCACVVRKEQNTHKQSSVVTFGGGFALLATG